MRACVFLTISFPARDKMALGDSVGLFKKVGVPREANAERVITNGA